MVVDFETRFMDLLWYAPHMNIEKVEVSDFMVGLNFSFHAKVRI
jgi:hypothetical protein